MASNDLSLDNLPLLFKKLILCDFLKTFADVDQLSVELVDLALLGQFEQVSFVVSIEVHWNRFVPTVSRQEADVNRAVSAEFGFVVGSNEGLGHVLSFADETDLCFLWFLSGDFVVKLDGLSWFFLDVETERFGSDAEVKGLGGVDC